MRLVAAFSVALASAALLTCSFDWDGYDPRAATEPGGGGATTTSGGGGGDGGMGTAGVGGTSTSTGGGGSGGGAQGGSGGEPPLGPWSSPQVIAALSDPGDDDDPTMTANGLILFFNSTRTGDGEIYVSTRASRSDPWGAPSLVTELNSGQNETNHTVSPDGLTMYLESNRGGAGYDVYVSARPDLNSTWSTPTLIDELNQQGVGEVSGVTSDGLLALVTMNPGMGTDTDLWLVTRPSVTDPWGTLVPITELNTGDRETEAWMHADGTSIVFTSNRPGGAGDGDLWFAERASTSDAFSTPVNMIELNADKYDSDPTLTSDLRYIVFAVPVGMNGERELFEASR